MASAAREDERRPAIQVWSSRLDQSAISQFLFVANIRPGRFVSLNRGADVVQRRASLARSLVICRAGPGAVPDSVRVG